MLNLWRKITLLLIFVFIVIMLWPINTERKYRGLKNDCNNHAIWMYQRLYEDSTPVDIAFLGSSHTLNGIDDSHLQNLLQTKHVLNFGYCRHGRNLDYFFAKEIIKHKNPKTIILEVREYENPFSHPVFPYFANNTDLITAYPFFNKDWLSDLSTAFQYRVQLVQESIWNESKYLKSSPVLDGRIERLDTISSEILKIEADKKRYITPDWKKEFNKTYPFHYIERIQRLCNQNNVQIIFLFIPSYYEGNKEPHYIDQLKAIAPVWLPPKRIWREKDFWVDPGHLNQAGATELTDWVASQISQSN